LAVLWQYCKAMPSGTGLRPSNTVRRPYRPEGRAWQRSRRSDQLTLEGTEATISRPFAPGQDPVTARTLPCDHDGGRVEIGFELHFLKDALSVLGDTVRFALSGPREPALITSDETPGVQIVIMPPVA
jgi:DNA polymerase III beta subunit, C-terminal domain